MSFQSVTIRALRLLADTERRRALRARSASEATAQIERQFKSYLNNNQCDMPDAVAEVLLNARDRVQFKREQFDAREAEATASMIEAETASNLAARDTVGIGALNSLYASELHDRGERRRIVG